MTSRLWHTLVTLALVGAVIALAVWAATSTALVTDQNGKLPVWTFLGLAALLAAFTVVMGWAITRQVGGALIDPRKGRMSLSRLQMLSWTILILSAYLNAFIVNISAGRTNPLDVSIPGELLAAMGISIGGLAGTQIVLVQKQNEHGTASKDADGAIVVSKDQRTTPSSEATRSAVFKADRAQWRDVFMGDTEATRESLDLGKIQLFYITLALILGYGISVATGFAHLTTGAAGGVGSLPALNQAFVALLALSHGGYLTTKAAS